MYSFLWSAWSRRSLLGATVATLALSTSCGPDQGFVQIRLESIGVTVGDFDDIAEPLKRLDVKHDWYDGIISANTWDEEYQSAQARLTVEGLLLDQAEMRNHDSLFIASGTRGLGGRQYNGILDDNQLITDEDVLENVRAFVRRGGSLLVTDWAYDLIEAAWPDYIDFVNDDAIPDDAQRGKIGDRRGSVDATVRSELLRERLELGDEPLSIYFNYSNWSVIESVSDDVEVWMSADIEYKPSNDETYVEAPNTPVMVSFNPEGELAGRVVFASFHVDAQTPQIIDTIIETAVGDLDEGSGTVIVQEGEDE